MRFLWVQFDLTSSQLFANDGFFLGMLALENNFQTDTECIVGYKGCHNENDPISIRKAQYKVG